MSDQLQELGELNHAYRAALAAFQARTGLAPQAVDVRGCGEEREKFARMDADLTATERSVQDAALAARIAKLEAMPQFDTRAAGASQSNDRNNPDSAAYAARWLTAAARGDLSEFRALSTGSSNAAIPTDLERRIVTKMHQASVLRQMSKVTTIDSKRTIAVENALPTTNKVAEAGSITASDPTFSASISITPIKYVCSTTISQEFLDDAIGSGGIGSGLQYVADRMGLSISKKLDEQYTIGDGVGDPQGIGQMGGATGILQNITLADDLFETSITGDNLIDMVHLVAPQYRAGNFKMLLSDSALKTIRKLKVNTSDYIWKVGAEGGIANGVPGTIYGVPYAIGAYVSTGISAAGTNTTDPLGKCYVIAGNFDYFEIFDRTGMTSMVDPYSAAANQQTTLYAWVRTDSHIMLPEAFAAIRGVNAA